MASLRKRYQNRSETNNDAPVTTAPTAAKLPEPITEQAAPEPNPADEKPSAVEQAEKDAIKKRIAELERAEDLQSAALDQQVRFARERQRQVAATAGKRRRCASATSRQRRRQPSLTKVQRELMAMIAEHREIPRREARRIFLRELSRARRAA
jgi:hypothetical protein